MAIVLRTVKNSVLTFDELDGNFTDLNGRLSTLETSGNSINITLTDLSGTGDINYNNVTGAISFNNNSGYITNGGVDLHLNQSNPTSGHVLSWNGSDYAWVSPDTQQLSLSGSAISISGGASIELSGIIGDIGPIGPPGTDSTVPGPQGIQGIQGVQGSAGLAITFLGQKALASELPPTSNTQGDAFFVQDDSSLYVWDGTAWVNGGAIVGPQGIQGPAGPAGGDSTVPGPQGIQGVRGEIGLTGAASTVPGPAGAAGTNGIDGTDGVDGAAGTNGIDGTDGVDGTGSAWADITSTPTTLSGYGITDGGGVTASSTDTFTNKSGNISQWTNDSNYLITVPAQTFASLTAKPTTLAGYGITDGGGGGGGGSYVNSDVDDHLNQSNPTVGHVLSWNGTDYAWVANSNIDINAGLGSSSVGALNDVSLAGIQSGQYLSWNGTSFVAASVSSTDISGEVLSALSNVKTSNPADGDVLTWNTVSNEWGPVAGGSGGGSSTEYFKLNYATNGTLSSISDSTSGVTATIIDSSSGEVQIAFSGYSFPPSNVLVYGYARITNEYVIMPLNKDMTTRKLSGGGSAGSPTAFGTLASLPVTLVLREADTGAARSFGTDTHAWIVISMI